MTDVDRDFAAIAGIEYMRKEDYEPIKVLLGRGARVSRGTASWSVQH